MKNIISGLGRTLLIMTLGFLTVLSCSTDDDSTTLEESVSLSAQAASLQIGETLQVQPSFTPNVAPQRNYSWSTSDPEVAAVEMQDDLSVIITAMGRGEATVTLFSSDQTVSGSLNLSVLGPQDDGVIKILAIGNSFSEDALERYLSDMALAENVPLVIGNLFIGLSSLEDHLNNARTNAAVYDYRKIVDGVFTSFPESTIEYAVQDENWDYISFQQVSGNSGQYETFVESLPALRDYVDERKTNPEVGYVLHQTWAYASSSTHSSFPNYGNDQEVMYRAIVDAVRRAKIGFGFDYVVPAGTAIQNGRNTLLGEVFTRDGHHLSTGIGRYTAAATWFEFLTGINVIGNAHAPEGMSEIEVEIAQHVAHAAVADPDRVTLLSDYQAGEAEPLYAPVFINFGHRLVDGWNSLTDHHEGASIGNLLDANDEYTNIALVVTQRFNAMNEAGESVTNTEFNMPSEVSTQSYYGNSRGVWQNLEIRQSQITLSGLDKNTTYNLCYFGSRSGVGDNRETKFITVGENVETVYLQTSQNTDEIACANGIQPDSNGNISITITAGENNDNGSGFYYFGAMRLAPGE